MDRIIVPVSELLSLAQELDADKMDYVELSIMEPLEEDGDIIPANLWASGFKSSMPDFRTDYDVIEHVSDFD